MANEYAIKKLPEDFIVKERMELDMGSGPYSYYLLSKRDYTTQMAVRIVSGLFHKRTKYINYSGNKDRSALTEQYISILHGPGRDLNAEGLSLKFLGRGRERINLGRSEGNHFEIVLRGLEKGPRAVEAFPNYFGEQRFGVEGMNHVIGGLMVRKDFRAACMHLKQSDARVEEHLKQFPNDFVGAIRRIPKSILRLYPHSYQSFLWNEIVSEYLGNEFACRRFSVGPFELNFPREAFDIDLEVPFPSPYSEMPEKVKGIYESVLEKENVEMRNFEFRGIPEVNITAASRPACARPEGLEIGRMEDDELFPGRKKCRVSFFLRSGCYATVALRALML